MFGLYWLYTGLFCMSALLWALMTSKDSEMYKEIKILLDGHGEDVDADFDKLGILCMMGTIYYDLSKTGKNVNKNIIAKIFLGVYDEAKEAYGRHSGKSSELQLFYSFTLILSMACGFIILPIVVAYWLTSKLKK